MMQVLIEATLLCVSIAGLVCIVLATVHDMKRVYTEAALRHEMRQMTKPRQPHVSIIIAYSKSIEQLLLCLRHVKKSHYKRYDVVAVMEGIGTDKRRELLAATRMKSFRIYSPHRDTNDVMTIMNAYRRSQRGELMVVLSANDLLEPTAIKKSVALLQRDSSLGGVRLLGELNEPGNIIQVYEVFSELSRRIMIKALTVVKRKRRQAGIAPAIYRHESIVRAVKTDVWTMEVVYRQGLASSSVQHYTGVVQWYIWTLRLVFIGVILYSSIAAALLQSAWPFIMAWAIVCLWLVAAVWSDETLRLKRKAMMGMSIPIGMFVITASYIVGGIAAMLRLKTF